MKIGRMIISSNRAMRGWLFGLGKYDLPNIDISRQESGFAIGEVVLPQATEPVVEAERDEVGPCGAEITSPVGERLGIVLPKSTLADDWNAEPFAERFEDLG